MSNSWTLERELIGLTECDDLASSLRSLGLLYKSEELAALATVKDWHRSGAETYGLVFAIQPRGREVSKYFMKACVAYDDAASLNEIFAQWLSRRAAVEAAGVATPQLYAVATALLVEEFIPQTLVEAIKSGAQRQQLVAAVGFTAAMLLNSGFEPFDARDWRSRGSDVVVIDFGQDLGPQHRHRGSEAGLLSEVIDSLQEAGVALSNEDLKTIGRTYEHHLEH